MPPVSLEKKVNGGEYGKIPLQTLEQSLPNLTFLQNTSSPPKSRENKNPVLEDSESRQSAPSTKRGKRYKSLMERKQTQKYHIKLVKSGCTEQPSFPTATAVFLGMKNSERCYVLPSLMTAGLRTYPHPPFSRNFPVFRFIIRPGVW